MKALLLIVALAAMYGVVHCIVAAASNVIWVVPAAGCLALSGYSCARLYTWLFYSR
ncbi:MAG: hypothetical protein JOZ39_07435 [Chloroflexi bacterium]|nr:hypothetical protein [Chloroflexota bacterium]